MYLKNSKIIVIKIGSSLLVDNNKKVRKEWLSSFAKDIKKLKDKNFFLFSFHREENIDEMTMRAIPLLKIFTGVLHF